MKFILASASPRRNELLKLVLEDFETIPSNFEEILPDGISVENAAEYFAVKKAEDVAKSHKDSLVIGCDTAVIFDGIIFGKPVDADDARRILKLLSGKTHTVSTGVALVLGEKSLSFTENVSVTFYPLSDEEIENYISSGLPFDKAGAYGIQDEFFLPVKEICGDYFAVVGLPVAKLKRMIKLFLKNI